MEKLIIKKEYVKLNGKRIGSKNGSGRIQILKNLPKNGFRRFSLILAKTTLMIWMLKILIK